MLKKQKAFTLMELMITVAIAAIVLGLAVPSFNTSILNNRSAALGEDFVAAINFTRSEAVKQNTRVSLCASSDGASCTGGVWTDGFIAFLDTAASDTTSSPTVGTVLRVWPKQNSSAVITTTRSFIRYTGLGTLANTAAGTVVFNTSMTHCTSTAARKITIGLSGLVAVERVTCP